MPIKCIYHGGCPDGYASAMGVSMAFSDIEDVELIPVGYHNDPPEMAFNDRVYIVDFSFSPEDTRAMAQQAASVTVYDHHKTARDAWFGPAPENAYRPEVVTVNEGNLGVLIDMNRSGAAITWDELHGGRPVLVEYVQDRDLWTWLLPDSRIVGAYILTLPHEPDLWEQLLSASILTLPPEWVERGRGAMAFQEKLVDECVHRAQLVDMGGRRFWLTNAPYIAGSRVAEELMEVHGGNMAAYWLPNVVGDYQYGFRSRNDVTVDDFAKQFGGGGHPPAAGCTSGHKLHTIVNLSAPK